MFQKSINVTFLHAVVTVMCMMVLILISARLLRSIQRQAKMRETAQVARKCLIEIESQAEKLRNLRRDLSSGKGSYLSQMTTWEGEKRNFISTHLSALLEEIRAERDRATVLDQCLKFIELITSSSVPS